MKGMISRALAFVDARSLRERQIMLGVAILLGLAVGYFGGLDALLERQEKARAAMRSRDSDVARLTAQLEEVRRNHRDPDAANRDRRDQLKRLLAETDAGVASKAERIVPPRRVAALLEELIRRHGSLELLSMRSLPPRPLLDAVTKDDRPGTAARKGDAAPARKGDAAPARGGNDEHDVVTRAARGIWRHGIALKVAGPYLDLVDYLSQLEQLPMQVFWNDVLVDAGKHPRAELEVTLFTINFDDYWLALARDADDAAARAASLAVWEAAKRTRALVRVGLADPLRPSLPGAPAHAGSEPGDAAPRALAGVWRVGDRRYAMIDEQVVQTGTLVGADRVVDITDTHVILRGPQGRVTLDVAAGIDRRAAGIERRAAAPAAAEGSIDKTNHRPNREAR